MALIDDGLTRLDRLDSELRERRLVLADEKKKKPVPVLLLRIELCGTHPLVWRRVWTPASIPLNRLHQVIQASMGWADYHLHEFHFDAQSFAPHGEHERDDNCKEERGVALDSLLTPRLSGFDYLYDMRDEWRHRIEVETSGSSRVGWHYPVCTGGANACPPEGIGGVRGYANFLATLACHDAAAPPQGVHALGGYFDPRGFDANAANTRMSKLRL